jgi:demethylmenaquinone methyltransferase / 2-methoxy-6-polyprenyl-1,4-benzoquinol methylase
MPPSPNRSTATDALFTRPRWFDRAVRRMQLAEPVAQTGTANFGFRQMAEHEKPKAVMHHFDRVAPRYDLMNNLLSFGIQLVWKRVAVGEMGLRSGDRVLDLCGGTADLAMLAMRKTGSTGRAVVCDLNRAMMAGGVAKVDRTGLSDRIAFVQGDAEKIPLADESFDAAMVGFGIRNLTHLEDGLREMYRVLRPGGIMMCLEFSKPVNPIFRWLYDFYSFTVMPFLGEVLVGNREGYLCLPETIRLFALPEELAEVLEHIGFTGVRYRRMTNGIAAVHIGVRP